MATKATGAEFKRFYDDEAWWPKDSYHDDADLTLNGELQPDGIDSSKLQDTDEITISGGVVYNPEWGNIDGPSLETYFKRWRKKQNTVIFNVECDKSVLDAVKEAIRQAGGKV